MNVNFLPSDGGNQAGFLWKYIKCTVQVPFKRSSDCCVQTIHSEIFFYNSDSDSVALGGTRDCISDRLQGEADDPGDHPGSGVAF